MDIINRIKDEEEKIKLARNYLQEMIDKSNNAMKVNRNKRDDSYNFECFFLTDRVLFNIPFKTICNIFIDITIDNIKSEIDKYIIQKIYASYWAE
ncbi:MAG: hypothetical protein WBI07_13390 [Mobilitalea sp.]